MAELRLSAATLEVDGQRLDAHSVIPWETDAATSFRALTPPPPTRPWAGLAALAETAKLKAEEVASGLLKKVITPAGEVGTELLGVGVAALARTASLTAGLLLTSVNADADPAKDADWQLYRRNHAHNGPIPPPPKSDELRLAELERAWAAHTLTAREEVELIALLAKVKGIHVQRLDELSDKPKHSPTPAKWKQKGGRIDVLPDGDWKYTDWKGNVVIYHSGFPVFDPHAPQQVDIPDMKGNCTSDFDEADEKAPLGPKQASNTWHHHENLKTMQEVPKDIHDRFTHYGARSIIKKQRGSTTSSSQGASTPKKSVIRKKKS